MNEEKLQTPLLALSFLLAVVVMIILSWYDVPFWVRLAVMMIQNLSLTCFVTALQARGMGKMRARIDKLKAQREELDNRPPPPLPPPINLPCGCSYRVEKDLSDMPFVLMVQCKPGGCWASAYAKDLFMTDKIPLHISIKDEELSEDAGTLKNINHTRQGHDPAQCKLCQGWRKQLNNGQ